MAAPMPRFSSIVGQLFRSRIGPSVGNVRLYSRANKGKLRTVAESDELSHRRKTSGKIRPKVASANANYQNEPNFRDNKIERTGQIALNKTKNEQLTYVKLEDGDRRFVNVVSTAKSKKYREEEGSILLEGKRLINDAFSAGVQLKSLYFTQKDLLTELLLSDIEYEYQLFKIQYRSLKIWSDVQTPSGLLAVFKKPTIAPAQSGFPLTIVCDNIRDPGNMGTIIRTAAAVGCQRILLSKGCVDIWEPKVLRSGCGAHFRIPMIANLEWSTISAYINQDSAVFLADNIKRGEVKKQIHSEELLKELEREDDTYEIRDNSSFDQEKDYSENNESEEVESFENRFGIHKQLAISTKPYHSVNYANSDSVALVIGGETEGLSNSAHKLIFDRFGQKIYIPMAESIESLNSAIASSVIMFEMKRQFQMKKANNQ